MATRRVKLEISIEKFSVKYEGDVETAQAVQDSVTRSLGALAEAQGRVIDVTPHEEPAAPALPSAPASPTPRRVKPRRKAIPAGVQGSDTNGASVGNEDDQNIAKTPKGRRPRGIGSRSMLFRLLEEGYFSSEEYRPVDEIRDRLVTKGYTFDVRNIASDLSELTKKEFFVRQKNDKGKWAYRQGPNRDYPGSQGSA